MNWEKFEQLNYISQTSDDSKTCAVLFHGYGADANDLASLGKIFQLKEDVDWFFPQGVLSVPIGPMMTGRAWFELRVSDFENLANNSLQDDGVRPADQKTIENVSRFLNHLGKLYDRVFIGGFSQGAILTSHSFYRLNFSPAGLLLMSGYLIAPSAMPTLPDALKVPFFQCHGQRDEVLPISGARKLYEKLQDMGLAGKWYEFPGAHEIPMDVIAETQIFLNSVLEKQG